MTHGQRLQRCVYKPRDTEDGRDPRAGEAGRTLLLRPQGTRLPMALGFRLLVSRPWDRKVLLFGANVVSQAWERKALNLHTNLGRLCTVTSLP